MKRLLTTGSTFKITYEKKDGGCNKNFSNLVENNDYKIIDLAPTWTSDLCKAKCDETHDNSDPDPCVAFEFLDDQNC